MTKAKMIETMQLQEAAAWLTLTYAESSGEESSWFKTCRSKWAVLRDAMQAMGIEPDHQLTDQVTAFNLRHELQLDALTV